VNFTLVAGRRLYFHDHSHLERIHSKSKKASQHTSWFKSWWNRQKIDQDIKRLIEFKKDCYEQFTVRKISPDWRSSQNYQLFSTTRIEGKADQIVDTATRILDTTTQTQATAVQMADTTTQIKVDTAQITSTTAQIQTDIVQVASTSARIEDNTGFLTNTMSQIEQRMNEIQVSMLVESSVWNILRLNYG
jgi:methyl-accepting chemotaxis protein